MPKGKSGIKRGTKGGKAQAPAQTTVSVPEVKTIAEANQLAVDLGLAQHADFTGLDVSVANEMIQELAATKAMLLMSDSDNLGFTGSIASMNTLYKQQYKQSKTVYGLHTSLWGKSCIVFNGRLLSSKKISSELDHLQEEISMRWSPVGTGTLRGLISHEIGHYLDRLYGLRNDTRINSLFNSHKGGYRKQNETLSDGTFRFTSKMAQALSEYANANIKEFIAEAWSEYRNNPIPRSLAKEVGDRIVEIAKGRIS